MLDSLPRMNELISSVYPSSIRALRRGSGRRADPGAGEPMVDEDPGEMRVAEPSLDESGGGGVFHWRPQKSSRLTGGTSVTRMARRDTGPARRSPQNRPARMTGPSWPSRVNFRQSPPPRAGGARRGSRTVGPGRTTRRRAAKAAANLGPPGDGSPPLRQAQPAAPARPRRPRTSAVL